MSQSKYFLALIFAVSAPAVSQWKWLQPTPQGNTIFSSTVVGGKAYFLGESGTVLMTTDGGATWEHNAPYGYPKDIGFYSDISNCRISFATFQRGYISRGGGLFYTTNAGRSWQRQNIFFEHPGAVYFSGPHYGFTTGDEYRTVNGGVTWSSFTLGNANDGYFGAFTSTDEHHVWAVSQGSFPYGGGQIMYTTNGGNSWQYRNSGLESSADSSFSLCAIKMNPSGLGIATGYVRTASGTTGIILRTSDFGQSWSRGFDRPQYNTVISPSDSIWILIGNDWWGAHGVAYQTCITRSSNTGLTWEKVFQVSYPSPAPRTGVWIPEHNIVLAAGFYGAMYKSTDIGKTWTSLWNNPRTFHDITFVYVPEANTSFGFAVGDWGTLMRSTDRGVNWSVTTIDAVDSYYLTTVEAKDKIVWIGGAGRKLARSTDRGISWERVATPLDSSRYSGYVFNSIAVFDSKRCMASATLPDYFNIETHAIYTTDGGGCWKRITPRRGLMINAVALPSSQYVLMAGADWTEFTNEKGFIWRSSNAGSTWDSLAFPKAVSQLVMFNTQEGLAVTYEKLYRTTDGGRSWLPGNVAWRTGYPYWGSLTGLTIPSEKRNSCIAYLNGGGGNLADQTPTGFVYSNDRGRGWVQTTSEHPNQENVNGIGSTDGIANIFIAAERGGFLQITSPTPVVYDPPSPNRIPPTGNLTSSPDSLPHGLQETSLIWTSDEAQKAWIDRGVGPVPVNGSRRVTVGTSTTFTIFFQNEWGIATYSAKVHVDAPQLPNLSQNYPNPFNQTTEFVLSIPFDENGAIRIYNLLGEEVSTLANERFLAGTHIISWNAEDYASGVYICRAQIGSVSIARKVLLLK